MKISLRKISLQLLFTILLFITYLGDIFNSGIFYMIFKHIDEAITLCFLSYILINYKRAYKIDRKIIIYWLLLCEIGLVSNLLYRYQGIMPIIIDLFAVCPRFIIGYYAISIYVSKYKIDVCKYVEAVCKLITSLLFLLALHDCFFSPIFEKSDYRYFMYSIKLMFPHVTYLAFTAVILLIYWGFTNRNRKNMTYMFMSSFLALVTLRSKAIAFIALYWVFYVWFIRLKRKINIIITFIGMCLSIFLVWDNISLTFFDSSRFSPRLLMLKDGFMLMLKHFPLGTGFATYGTYMAQVYYSPLYKNLGYNTLYGMSQNNALFLSDSFWPSIISQFGVFGFVLFVLILICLIKKSLVVLKVDKYAGFSMLMCLAYLVVTSFAESAFWNPMSFLLMILYGAFENYSKYNGKNLNYFGNGGK